MTNPTNWPNPDRPGYPMFPERDGWHNFVGHQSVRPDDDDGESPDISPIYLFCCFWDSELRAWGGFDESSWCVDDCADLLRDEEYHGPCLTPTQIAELLAGEQERCLTIVIDEQWNFPSNPINQTKEAATAFKACERIIEKIRNLGAAP